MKLISEEIESVDILTEEKDGKKTLYITGPFLQAEVVNRNKRCYPIQTMVKEVKRYSDEFVSKGRALGELGHPDGPQINLDRVSHKIVSLAQEGNNFMGKAKVMDTPYGKIVKNLIDEGAKLGVSTRGMGTLKPENGSQIVQSDFYLATAGDIVADPSAPAAFVEGIMEGKEWIYNANGTIEEVATQIRHEIDRDVIAKRLSEKRKMAHFNKFLSALK